MEQLHNSNNSNPAAPAPIQATSDNSAGGIDIRAILGRAIRQWYLFIIFPFISIFLGWMYIRYDVATYEVRAVILVKESAADQAVASLVSGVGGGFLSEPGNSLTNQIEIMGSYSILRAVVDSLDLAVQFTAEGRLKDTDLYEPYERPFLLTAYESYGAKLYNKELRIKLLEDGQSYQLTEGEVYTTTGRLGEPLTMPFGEITLINNPDSRASKTETMIVVRNPIVVARMYSNKLNIRTIRGSELLELSMVDEVPTRAIDVISAVIDSYNEATIAEKIEVASKTTNFVNDRLNYLTRELNEVELAAEDYVISNDIVGGTEREINSSFERLRENERKLIELKLKEEALDRVEGVLNTKPNDTLSYLAYSLSLENLNLSPLIGRYNQLLQERERLLLSAQPDNPVLLPVEEQIQEVSKVIRKALNEGRNKLQEQEQEFIAASKEIWQYIRRIPGKERGLMAIERQQNIREQLYLFLLQKREETALSSAAAVANVRILESPMLRGTTSASTVQVYSIAFLAGLLLPFGIVALQELLDDTVKMPDQLKRLTATPFLGAIAQEPVGKRIVVTRSSRTAIAEMFRMLRTNLQFLGAGKQQQVMLVTSSMGGEGKTFVCINLGMSLAISGKKVILLGMDLRKPKLGKYLTDNDDYAGIGITNYLTGNAGVSEIIKKSEAHENLDFISSGVIPPNPAELLLLPETNRLLNSLRERYDYILIDMPPVGLVTDALLLGEHVDAALYVTRFGKTKHRQVSIADEIYQTGKLPNMAIVLNGVRTDGGYGYGYGYSYGYGYGYGYGYYEK